jgi:hypothetical protein
MLDGHQINVIEETPTECQLLLGAIKERKSSIILFDKKRNEVVRHILNPWQ